jgi:hypothetical protein
VKEAMQQTVKLQRDREQCERDLQILSSKLGSYSRSPCVACWSAYCSLFSITFPFCWLVDLVDSAKSNLAFLTKKHDGNEMHKVGVDESVNRWMITLHVVQSNQRHFSLPHLNHQVELRASLAEYRRMLAAEQVREIPILFLTASWNVSCILKFNNVVISRLCTTEHDLQEALQKLTALSDEWSVCATSMDDYVSMSHSFLLLWSDRCVVFSSLPGLW